MCRAADRVARGALGVGAHAMVDGSPRYVTSISVADGVIGSGVPRGDAREAPHGGAARYACPSFGTGDV